MDRHHHPVPDFYPCAECKMKGACKAAHHCAMLPRPVADPAIPNQTLTAMAKLTATEPEFVERALEAWWGSVRLGA